MDHDTSIKIKGKQYQLKFSNAAFMVGLHRLKKQGYELSWADLIDVLQVKDLTIADMQSEPFVFAALVFIGVQGVKGQRIEFDTILDDLTIDRMGYYAERLGEIVTESFNGGEPPVELSPGEDGPDPLAENGSGNAGPSAESHSDSEADPNPTSSDTTNSGA